MDLNRASRYLSYLLRHHPEAAGITLDAHGWADVDQLLAGMKKHRITRPEKQTTPLIRAKSSSACRQSRQTHRYNATSSEQGSSTAQAAGIVDTITSTV